MSIRLATEQDVEQIQRVVIDSVGPYPHEDFNEHGWEYFRKANSINEILNRLKNPDYIFVCYGINKKIVGLITVLKQEKIDQLFVLPEAQHMGVARKLWLAIKDQYCRSAAKFWVRSSSLAVPVYQKFGFVQQGERKEHDGIFYYYMTYESMRKIASGNKER